MTRSFWGWLCRFAYRRWARAGLKPVGVPFNRDPEHPCDCYEPRRRKLGDWQDCRTDGHYLCRECCHRDTVHEPDDADRGNWIKVYTIGDGST